MTQHEQRTKSAAFRTREEQVADLSSLFFNFCNPHGVARSQILEAEARGAAEQRRKDAEGVGPVGYARPGLVEAFQQAAKVFPSGTVEAKILPARDETHTESLCTRPDNVAALGASFVWLVEDMRKKDQSDPPSARFDMLFGDDEVSISEARERLKDLGIESLYITDEWEEGIEENELSCADVEALPPLHEDEQKAGWRLASAWDTEDGTIIRHYVRPLLTLDQDTANVAALEARVKELEGALRNVRSAIEHADPKALCCTLWMPGQPETVVDYISAAIREGGKHG